MTVTFTVPDPMTGTCVCGMAKSCAAWRAHTAAQFARAIIMLNLKPVVTTVELALEYRQCILLAVPEGMAFESLMTCYLTDNLPPEEIVRAKAAGVVACKLYPACRFHHQQRLQRHRPA